MKIVFLGTPRIAVPSFTALLDAGHEISLVVTQPDRPVGRSRRAQPPPVKQAALERGIEVFQPRRVRNAAFRETLRSAAPDLLAVVAYGRILPVPVLEIGPLGPINVHFSLLPRFRGAAPVQWTLASAESTTGVTTMFMNEKMDEGDILMQREFPIEPDEHTPALQLRLAGAGAELLVETVRRLAEGSIEGRPQDHSAATFAPPLSPADGQVDPGLPARLIEGRIRGFDPWPGVWVRRSGKRLRLVEARQLPGAPTSEPPGTVVQLSGKRLALVCGEGTRLELLSVQPEGRRVLGVRDAVNGRQLAPGDQLEPDGPAE